MRWGERQDFLPRFSIRKLTIGVFSVMIASVLWTTGGQQKVEASDTQGNELQTEEVVKKTKSESATPSSEKTNQSSVPIARQEIPETKDASTQTSVQSSDENKGVKQAVPEVKDPAPAKLQSSSPVIDYKTKTPAQVAKPSTQTKDNDVTPAVASKSDLTEDKSSEAKDDNENALNVKTPEKSSTSIASLTESKVTDPSKKSIASPYKDINSITYQDTTDHYATLGIDNNHLGVGSNNQKIHLTYTYSGQKGDTWQIAVPFDGRSNSNDSHYYFNYVTQVSGDKVTVTENKDAKDEVQSFTGVVNQSGLIQIIFEIATNDNYAARDAVVEVGKLNRDITLTYNHHQVAKKLHFTDNVVPQMKPQLTRVTPDNVYPGVEPNTNVIYRFDVNENIGTETGGDTSKAVNSGVNEGTTITIPVPSDFSLNKKATLALNGKSNGEFTIDQDGMGQDIIINVAAGQGKQSWQGPTGYYLVGQYKVDEKPAKRVLARADRVITIAQKLNSKDPNHQTITATCGPWSETILGNDYNAVIQDINMNAFGAESDQKLIQSRAKNKILNYFSLTNNTPLSFNSNYPVTITLDMGDGLAVSEVKTPKIAGLNNFTYTIDYWDGSQQKDLTIKAGDIVHALTGKYIKSIAFTPDSWASTQGTDDTPHNMSILNQNTTANTFQAIGSVADRYFSNIDDQKHNIHHQKGDKLQTKDEIISGMTVNLQSYDGKITTFKDYTVFSYQFYVADKDNPSEMMANTEENNTVPATQNAGNIGISNPNTNQNQYIKDPIFYFVLPKYTNTDINSQISGYNFDHGKPIITTYQVGDRQIVKLDFKNYNFDLYQGSILKIALNNDGDACEGIYPWELYVVSPTTKLEDAPWNAVYSVNPAVNKNTSTYSQKNDPFNRAWIEGHTANTYLINGGENWRIAQGQALTTPQFAQGNKGNIWLSHAVSDDKGSGQMSYAISIVNELEQSGPTTEIMNLPFSGDKYGSSFNFELSNIIAPENLNGFEIYGATNSYNLENKDVPVLAANNGWQKWSGIQDKSKIRSIAIHFDNLPAKTIAGRFIIQGKDPTLASDAGKTDYLASVLYGLGDGHYVIQPEKGEKNYDNAQIAVSGKSAVNVKFSYEDDNGQEHEIVLPAFTQTLTDNQDILHAPTAEELNAALAKLSELKGYEFVDIANPTIENSDHGNYANGAKNLLAAIGKEAKYYFDGDSIVYALKRSGEAWLRYYDDTIGQFISGMPTEKFSGSDNDTNQIKFDNSGVQNLLNKHYDFVKVTDGANPLSKYTLVGNDFNKINFGKLDLIKDEAGKTPSQVFVVHFVHNIKINTESKSATRTIEYVDESGNAIADAITDTVRFEGQSDYDEVAQQLVVLNKDGKEVLGQDGKPVQGQVTWTYVADNGSRRNGNTYTFAPKAERASIENKGVTYLYKSVDPAAYTTGQGSVKGYSVDANGQIKDLVIKVIYTKKNPAQPTRPQTSVPAPTDPQPTSVQPTIPNPAPQPTQDQPTNLQLIEDQPIIPVPQPEVIPLPAIKTQIKQYNYSNVPHSEILQTHKQNATVMPHAQKKIISHVQSVRPQAEILPSGKIKTLKGELLGHVNKKGQVLNAKGEVIGHLKQMNASVLPQTGEKQDNIWAIVLGSLAAGSSIIVLAYDKRKKQE